MKKLMLDTAALRVESFEMGDGKGLAGTVQAHVGTQALTCATQCATCVTNCATGPCYCASLEQGC